MSKLEPVDGGVFAQCNGCGFISRRCATQAEAIADLDLETNAGHRSIHFDTGPFHLTHAEVIPEEAG